jgi:glutamyl-tRNA synthetase
MMNSNKVTGDKKIVVRFPPSPTGPLHIGNVRTALFNYFFARKNKGDFVVRVEDTDRERSKKEYEDEMLESLIWLGLKRDGQLWRQSERIEVYKKYIQKLIDDGKAYISHETEGVNREVVRFKNPNITVSFQDLIRGTVTFDTTELKDFIIARNVNEPIYHLAVVIDDFEAGITHVIRGEDHISNTPRQILIGEAIGAPRPVYGHIPLILAPDRSKLSKRKHGPTVALSYYRDKGYLPEALVNYMALLGWNPGTEQEIFTLDELINTFDIEKVQKGAAIFDEEKLKWINKEHMKRLPTETISEEVRARIESSQKFKDSGLKLSSLLLSKILPLLFERIDKWSDITEMINSGEFDFLFSKQKYKKENLFWKEMKDSAIVLRHIQWLIEELEKISDEDWITKKIKDAVLDYATKEGRGEVLWPMRYALSGKEKSPDPFTLASILGKSETIERLQYSKKLLKS